MLRETPSTARKAPSLPFLPVLDRNIFHVEHRLADLCDACFVTWFRFAHPFRRLKVALSALLQLLVELCFRAESKSRRQVDGLFAVAFTKAEDGSSSSSTVYGCFGLPRISRTPPC